MVVDSVAFLRHRKCQMSVEFYPLLFVSTACCDVTGAERKKFNDQEIRLGSFSVV